MERFFLSSSWPRFAARFDLEWAQRLLDVVSTHRDWFTRLPCPLHVVGQSNSVYAEVTALTVIVADHAGEQYSHHYVLIGEDGLLYDTLAHGSRAYPGLQQLLEGEAGAADLELFKAAAFENPAVIRNPISPLPPLVHAVRAVAEGYPKFDRWWRGSGEAEYEVAYLEHLRTSLPASAQDVATFAQVVRNLGYCHGPGMLALLAYATPRQRATLVPQDLVGAHTSSDPDVRRRAILALAELLPRQTKPAP